MTYSILILSRSKRILLGEFSHNRVRNNITYINNDIYIMTIEELRKRVLSTAHKTCKESVLEDSVPRVQNCINDKKTTCQQTLHRQCEFGASLKSLNETDASHMSIALFEEYSQLQKKIDYEKDLPSP